jgi:hypothetical protein
MKRRKIHTVLVGKREGKRPYGRNRRRWPDIIRWKDVIWIHLTGYEPMTGSCIHNAASVSLKCWELLD